jgi:hypothetical protein
MSDRYGHPRTNRLVIAVAVVVAIGALVWLAWAIKGKSSAEVTSGLTKYHVVNAHEATASFEVHLSSTSVKATCLLQAQAEDHSVVGEAHVKVPHNRGREMTLTETLRTERKAILVSLLGCTTPTQKQAQ